MFGIERWKTWVSVALQCTVLPGAGWHGWALPMKFGGGGGSCLSFAALARLACDK